MLSFVKERKASAVMAALVPSVPTLIRTATPTERAAALVLSNVLLIVGSRAWGRSLLISPAKMERDVVVEALCIMADEHARLEGTAAALNGRAISDPALSAFRWELMANEIVTLTIGMGLDPSVRPIVYGSWKSLWAARRFGEDAIKAMAYYAKSYSVEPTPKIDGKRPDVAMLRRLGQTLPPMFRNKKKASAA
jgi:hypothetical protein